MKLATIETVREVKPHANADRLELATIQGWQTVVKKGEFKAGDSCVFVPPDTILPFAEWSEFLRDKNRPDKPIRLRTAKIRGEFSQGLVLPLSVLPESTRQWHEGADVGAELGIRKYEKEIPKSISGIQAGDFPSWVAPRTDEDNGLSNLKLVDFVLRNPVIATIKLDGSSCTIVVEGGIIKHVCSRNLDIKEDDKNAFWCAAKKLRFPSSFTGVVQGELMGPGIQGNQLGLSEPTLYVFQVGMDGSWLCQGMANAIAKHAGASFVWTVEEYKSATLSELQTLADRQTIETPQGTIPAEGIVVRPVNPISSGSGRPLGFKLINRNYGE